MRKYSAIYQDDVEEALTALQEIVSTLPKTELPAFVEAAIKVLNSRK